MSDRGCGGGFVYENNCNWIWCVIIILIIICCCCGGGFLGGFGYKE